MERPSRQPYALPLLWSEHLLVAKVSACPKCRILRHSSIAGHVTRSDMCSVGCVAATLIERNGVPCCSLATRGNGMSVCSALGWGVVGVSMGLHAPRGELMIRDTVQKNVAHRCSDMFSKRQK
jgi:hypothetical protein